MCERGRKRCGHEEVEDRRKEFCTILVLAVMQLDTEHMYDFLDMVDKCVCVCFCGPVVKGSPPPTTTSYSVVAISVGSFPESPV